MKLKLSWFKYDGRFYPVCETLESGNHSNLLCLLVDDGGLGIEYQISWLSNCITKCKDVLHGVRECELFTTELFAADIYLSETLIYTITAQPDSADRYQTTMFLHIMSDWVSFLKKGIQEDAIICSYF